jgi:hypothetical protein
VVVLFRCMNPVMSQVVANFREFPNVSDEEILRKLVAVGIERAIAARLVEFVPMAYCRLIFADSGIRFSECFRRKLADGSLSAERPLDSEPLWGEAISFASAEKQRGVSGRALLTVAARSSEFDAVNQLANQGSELKDIVLTTIVFQWPEGGPEH